MGADGDRNRTGVFSLVGLGGLCIGMLAIVLSLAHYREERRQLERVRSESSSVDALFAHNDAERITDALLVFAETPRVWDYADAVLLLSLIDGDRADADRHDPQAPHRVLQETMRAIATRLRRGLPIDDGARALLIDALLKQFDHDDPTRRAITARHVVDAALHRDPRVMRRLEALLHDPDSDVQRAAEAHIARIGVIDQWTACAQQRTKPLVVDPSQ